MLIIKHKEQPLVSWRPGNKTMKHSSETLGSTQLTTGEQWFETGVGAPMHWHPEGIEEVICVFKGKATFWFDGHELELREGQTIILPPTKKHGFVAQEPFHNGGGGLSSAVQTTIFEGEPDRIYDIGATRGVEVDAHRRLRDTAS
jgi:quercetin dioxygenase-like cupin family protein